MVGLTDAKAIENNFFVGEERRLGDQNRLETDVVQAVNVAFQRTFFRDSRGFRENVRICKKFSFFPCFFFFKIV